MIETVLALTLAAGAFAGLAGVLGDEWDRMRCAVLTFEAGHERLVKEPSASMGRVEVGRDILTGIGKQPLVRVTENADIIQAEGQCGRARERVNFVRLEAARW